MIPTQIIADFGDANWKIRLAALEEMTTWVEGVVGEVDCELVVRFLMKRGANEKNFQVRLQIATVKHQTDDHVAGFEQAVRHLESFD